jgi:predicted nucleic acid binding AN1-type Zn finger protein
VVYPLNEALPNKKSHAAIAFQKEKCAGCGEALPFFGIIINEKGRFCQYHYRKFNNPEDSTPTQTTSLKNVGLSRR